MRRSWRDFARDASDGLLAMARAKGSSFIGSAFDVAASLVIAEHDDEAEEQDDAEVYGHAPLLYRPADETSEGFTEAVVWRYGDERVVIATKDRRWQVELEKGEVCLRALGENKPLLVLRTDGTAVLQADTVKIGDADASHSIALGDVIKDFLTNLKSWMDGHTHEATTTATIGSSATVGLVTVLPPSSSSPSVPDIESRHLVED